MAEHQSSLFTWLAGESGQLTAKQQVLVTTLGLVRIEEFIYSTHSSNGARRKSDVPDEWIFLAPLSSLRNPACPIRCSKSSFKTATPNEWVGHISRDSNARTAREIVRDIKRAELATNIQLDVAGGGIPVSGILTSASTHDSQKRM
jgi:hypothetical protein